MRFKHDKMSAQIGNRLIPPGEIFEIPDDEAEEERLLGLGFEKQPNKVGRPREEIKKPKGKAKSEEKAE